MRPNPIRKRKAMISSSQSMSRKQKIIRVGDENTSAEQELYLGRYRYVFGVFVWCPTKHARYVVSRQVLEWRNFQFPRSRIGLPASRRNRRHQNCLRNSRGHQPAMGLLLFFSGPISAFFFVGFLSVRHTTALAIERTLNDRIGELAFCRFLGFALVDQRKRIPITFFVLWCRRMHPPFQCPLLMSNRRGG